MSFFDPLGTLLTLVSTSYREVRHFSPWLRHGIEDYYLESIVERVTGQRKVPFGDGVISTRDTCFACETCEELFTPEAPHGPMGLDGKFDDGACSAMSWRLTTCIGVEIFTNSSGSHFEIRKLKTRLDLIIEGTKKSGGIYLVSTSCLEPPFSLL